MVFSYTYPTYCFHTLRQDPFLSHFPLQESLSKKNHSDRGCEKMQYLILITVLEIPTQVFLVAWSFLGQQLSEFL